MKTTMRNRLLICLLAIAMAVPLCAVNYKSTYSGSRTSPAYGSMATTFPSLQFRSTNVYAEQWAEETSLLNSDGSVNTEAYMGGPRRLGGTPTPGGGGSGPGTPDDEDDDDNQQPLGDGMIPLLLLAVGYIMFRLGRCRKMVP